MKHLIRSVRFILRDPSLPRPLRALVAFGLLPIPGPLDEAALVLAALVLVLAYRPMLREAWRCTASPRPGQSVVRHINRRLTPALLATVAAVLVLVATVAALPYAPTTPASHGRCFPLREWNRGSVDAGLRPCAQVRRVYEDGSIVLAVMDANGTTRYTVGIGARDR